MELRDKVARAICSELTNDPECLMLCNRDYQIADAAIATVQEVQADTITTLRAENAALRGGLAFYADKANYARFYSPEGFGPSGREPVLADFGNKARALLDTNHAK